MNLLRQLAAFALLSLLTAFCIAFAGWSLVEHYNCTRSALELSGTEPLPLATDPLLGSLFDALFPRATLSHAIAMSLAGIEAVGAFIIAHQLLQCLEMARHWRESVQRDEPDEAREARWRLGVGLLFVAAMVLPLLKIFEWEIEMAHLRTLVELYRVQQPDTAASEIPSWTDYVTSHPSSVVLTTSAIGAYAWAAMIPAGAFALEWCFWMLSQRLTLIGAAFDALFAANDNDLPTEESEPVEATASAQVPDPVSEAPPAASISHESSPSEETCEVVGAAAGTRVAFTEACARPDLYHVDRSTRRVWALATWEELRRAA